MKVTCISEQFAVGPQIGTDEVSEITAAGYCVVICNRPDGEEPGQPAASEIAAACEAAGIAFHHLPFQRAEQAAELVDAFRDIIGNADGPVFAYCRSGQRCAYLWQTAQA